MKKSFNDSFGLDNNPYDPLGLNLDIDPLKDLFDPKYKYVRRNKLIYNDLPKGIFDRSVPDEIASMLRISNMKYAISVETYHSSFSFLDTVEAREKNQIWQSEWKIRFSQILSKLHDELDKELYKEIYEILVDDFNRPITRASLSTNEKNSISEIIKHLPGEKRKTFIYYFDLLTA